MQFNTADPKKKRFAPNTQSSLDLHYVLLKPKVIIKAKKLTLRLRCQNYCRILES